MQTFWPYRTCPTPQILEVAKAICDRSDFVVCRLKDRFKHPTSAMWRDVMINGFFKHGARHMVEVQLHHNSMLFVRGNLGGHYIYARFRALMEAVDTAKAEWAKAKDGTSTGTTALPSSDAPGPQCPPDIDIDGTRDDSDCRQEVAATPQPPLEREPSAPTPASPSDPFLALVERVRVNLRLPPMPPLDIIEAGAEEVGLESDTGNWAEVANALAEELGLDLRC